MNHLLKIVNLARPIVTEILTYRRFAVVRLVRALLQKNRLTGDEAINLIRQDCNRKHHSQFQFSSLSEV
jgi:hypothetical protein